jgi:hypothetical protein
MFRECKKEKSKRGNAEVIIYAKLVTARTTRPREFGKYGEDIAPSPFPFPFS